MGEAMPSHIESFVHRQRACGNVVVMRYPNRRKSARRSLGHLGSPTTVSSWAWECRGVSGLALALLMAFGAATWSDPASARGTSPDPEIVRTEEQEPAEQPDQKVEPGQEEESDQEEEPEPPGEGSKKATESKEHVRPKRFRLFIGYGSYSLDDFNDKMRAEGNEEISGGLNVGLEFFSEIELKVPVAGEPTFFLPTIGVEYLEASSTTSHPSGSGRTTVDWELAVLGFYVAPEFALKAYPWLYLRPVGVGYYTLGQLLDAGLTVSDRPGELEVSGTTVGGFGEIGFKWKSDGVALSLLGGYRILNFTDVTRKPTDGFTAVPGGPSIAPSALPEDLDFSGPFLKLGLSLEMGGGDS